MAALFEALDRRHLALRHQPRDLDYYLDEFTFRFNRRSSKARGLLFYRLLEQAVVTEPVPYRQLVTPSLDPYSGGRFAVKRIGRTYVRSGPPSTLRAPSVAV